MSLRLCQKNKADQPHNFSEKFEFESSQCWMYDYAKFLDCNDCNFKQDYGILPNLKLSENILKSLQIIPRLYMTVF